MAANDEDLAAALELHKQLNAIPLRARRGHGQELAHQPSLDRLKRDKGSAKPRSKRTNSSSQDHPSGKKQRTSDPDEHGHTSARQRHIKRDPEGQCFSACKQLCVAQALCGCVLRHKASVVLTLSWLSSMLSHCGSHADSHHSQHGGSDQQHEHKRGDGKHCDSRDSGMAAGPDGQQLALLHDLDPLQLLDESSQPLQAAAMYAAHKAKQQAVQQPGPPGVYVNLLQRCPAVVCGGAAVAPQNPAMGNVNSELAQHLQQLARSEY